MISKTYSCSTATIARSSTSDHSSPCHARRTESNRARQIAAAVAVPRASEQRNTASSYGCFPTESHSAASLISGTSPSWAVNQPRADSPYKADSSASVRCAGSSGATLRVRRIPLAPLSHSLRITPNTVTVGTGGRGEHEEKNAHNKKATVTKQPVLRIIPAPPSKTYPYHYMLRPPIPCLTAGHVRFFHDFAY